MRFVQEMDIFLLGRSHFGMSRQSQTCDREGLEPCLCTSTMAQSGRRQVQRQASELQAMDAKTVPPDARICHGRPLGSVRGFEYTTSY